MGANPPPPPPPYSNNLYIITYVSNFKKILPKSGGGLTGIQLPSKIRGGVVDRHSTPLQNQGGGG